MYGIQDSRSGKIRVTSNSRSIVEKLLEGFCDKWQVYRIVRIYVNIEHTEGTGSR